jgi:hypothetical protein
MKGGVWKLKVLNLVQQFLQWLVQQYHKMLKTWGGITTATKLLLLLWFRVLDKVLSLLLHKLLLLLWLLDKLMVFFAKVLYDNAAIGGYIKVTGTTVTSANIAAEC